MIAELIQQIPNTKAEHRDRIVTRGPRNVIERYAALAKPWRGIATRYDKLAITYRAGATICAILTWLRLFGDPLGTA